MNAGNIEDIYELSPMQQGLLFHTIADPDSGVYFEQLSIKLQGNLNIAAFQRAWQAVVNRHPILRTAFYWEELEQPYQVVYRQVELAIAQQDWRELSPQAQEQQLEIFLKSDREQGFDLSQAPLLRLALLQIADDAYYFVRSHHHIILEGWSWSLLWNEINTLYHAFCQGKTLNLVPACPYRDYITWLQQQDLSKAEAFWRRQLQGFTAPTPLVVDRITNNALPSPAGEDTWQHLDLSVSTTTALQSFARQHQLTLNVLLQGAFALLLSRYSGETNIVFGITTSGRPAELAGVESIVGLFLNTLPLRVQVIPDTFLVPWLKQLQAQQALVSQYEYVPLIEIQKWSEVPRGLPLFESILVFNNYPVDAGRSQLSESIGASNYRSFEKTNYPLALVIKPGQQLRLEIAYDPCRFEEDAISRLLGHLKTLLESIPTHPAAQLRDLPLLTAPEWQQLLVEWNHTQSEYPQRCIHELFEAQVERTPDAVAVVFEGASLTYRELNQQANQLAHYLRGLGVEAETLVGICLERSLGMIVALLAVLKAGGAYVPLDPKYPKERLAFMLTDAQMPILLTQAGLINALPQHQARVVYLDKDWEVIQQESSSNPVSQTTARDLAYILYTSGSTGQPKGVCCRHIGVVNLLTDFDRRATLSVSDRCSLYTSFSFDVSVYEIFSALLIGGSLHIVPDSLRTDTMGFIEWLQARQIQSAYIPPFMLPTLSVWLEKTSIPLKRLLVGIEPINQPLLSAIQQRIPGLQIINGYGPTEATICATLYSLKTQSAPNRNTPIGRPVQNTQIYILDAALQPLPIGIPGELYIGGIGLAPCYLNRPDLTAERFIDNPFLNNHEFLASMSSEFGENSLIQNSKLYKTGDLARYLPDGNIEFLGRIDYQVKIRGFRIELGEIETVLNQHPIVQQAVVVAREDKLSNKRLVAYLVQRPTNQESQELVPQLRSFLGERLPDYMIPSAFVTLEALPLTPNGKVDRHRLPAPNVSPELEATFAPPTTPIQELLAGIWAQVLECDRVGIYDNFFELGGDSILSIQITARANQAGLQITPKQLLEHQTIAGLASVVGTRAIPRAQQGIVTGAVPLTPIQHWFFEQELTDLHHWNQSLLLGVRGTIDPALLEQAVQHLLERHDTLRLRFTRNESVWQQVNAGLDEIGSIPFSCINLSGLPAAEQETAFNTSIAELQASLSLSAGQLVRVALFDCGNGGNCLFITIHHLAVDGVSWRILLADLEQAYQQLSRGGTVALPPKTTSFQRWSEALPEYMRSTAFQQERHYWLLKPRESVSRLPVDRPGGENTVAFARTVSVSLTVEETRALLQEVPAAYRTQIEDVLLTALVQAFTQWMQGHSLLVDLEGHGRETIAQDIDLSQTVGWFTTIYPVLLTLEGIQEPGEAIKAIKEQLRAVPHRGIGYGMLRYLSQDESAIAQLRDVPQSEVAFNYLGQLDRVLSQSSLFEPSERPLKANHSPRGTRPYLITINGFVREGQLQLKWEYGEQIHEQTTIAQLAQAFIEALRSLIAHCQSPEATGYTPSDFPKANLTQQKLDQFLAQINQRSDNRNKNIQDIYALSPAQQGILFHSLYSPESEVYLCQNYYTLRGHLNVSAFECAWQQVVSRHAALRTSFYWENLDNPLQLVNRQVNLSLEQYDWREIPPVEQQQRLAAFLEGDRQKGFNLSQESLMRLTLIRIADDRYQFIWSKHHLILDGWSTTLVLKEIVELYEALCQGQDLPFALGDSFGDYIAWLQQQDLSKAEVFWRQALSGVQAPTPLIDPGVDRLSSLEEGHDQQRIKLSAVITAALQSLAQQHQLTLNTLVQGAWAVILSHYSGKDDVVYGSTVSGRPADLTGAESIVGMFINILPIRIEVDAEQFLLPWLSQFQAQMIQMLQYEYSPLIEIQGWSEVARGVPLFESIVGFENYPVDRVLREWNVNLEIENASTFEKTNYPLTLLAMPGLQLEFVLLYERRRFSYTTIARFLGHLEILLNSMATQPEVKLNALKKILADADEQQRTAKEEVYQQTVKQKLMQVKRKSAMEK